MQKPQKNFLLSLVDQSVVSGANFLTIALGAVFLPIGEQGKLIYVYTTYIALVLLNVSVYFSAANIMAAEVGSQARYEGLLLKFQVATALLTSTLTLAVLAVFHQALAWQVSLIEATFLLLFLSAQQVADFLRRSGYVFGRIGNVTVQSLWLYGARIATLLYFRPDTLSGFLLLMLLPALPVALAGVGKLLSESRGYVDAWKDKNKNLLREHVNLSKWNILNMPIRWAGLHLPVMLAGALHSVEAAAILGTIRAITTFVNVLLEMLETFVPAWLSSKYQGGETTLRRGSMMLLYVGSAVWIVGALAIGTFGEAIVSLMLGAEYRHYTPILYIMWAANGIYFVGRAIGLHFRIKKNAFVEFAGLATGAFALPFAIPLIVYHGALGGAWCLAIVQMASLAGLLSYGVFFTKKL